MAIDHLISALDLLLVLFIYSFIYFLRVEHINEFHYRRKIFQTKTRSFSLRSSLLLPVFLLLYYCFFHYVYMLGGYCSKYFCLFLLILFI